MTRRSILYVFLLAFCLFIAVPTILFFWLLRTNYTNTLNESLMEKSSYTLNQMASQYDKELEALTYTMAVIVTSNNNSLLHMANDFHLQGSSSPERHLLENQLTMLTSINRGILSVVFFFDDGEYYAHRRQPSLNSASLRNEPWFTAAMANDNRAVYAFTPGESLRYSGAKNLLVAARSLGEPDSASGVDAVAILANVSLFDAVRPNTDTASGDFFVLDELGRVITSSAALPQPEGLMTQLTESVRTNTSGSFIFEDDRKSVLVTYTQMDLANWTIVNTVHMENLTRDTNRTVASALLFYIGFLFVFMVFSVLTYRRIIRPVRALTAAMQSLDKDGLEPDIQSDWHSYEFNALVSTFLNMSRKIRELIDEIDIRERRKRELEIEALQYQINPHFIKNTLNSIRLLAMISKNDSIRETTEALETIVSDSLTNTSTTTTLAEELNRLHSYFTIMWVRYGDQFTVEYDVPDELRGCRLLKMLLQPIAENAIFHGMVDRETPGHICIGAQHFDDVLVLSVTDNGAGMAQGQIRSLLAGDGADGHKTTRIGVRNVVDRIRLNYGEQYGLSIQSQLGAYTRVIIRIPYLSGSET